MNNYDVQGLSLFFPCVIVVNIECWGVSEFSFFPSGYLKRNGLVCYSMQELNIATIPSQNQKYPTGNAPAIKQNGWQTYSV